MKKCVWSDEKNEILKRGRGVSFEEVAVQIANGEILNVLEHPNPEKYPNQRVFVIRIQNYAFLVPFSETREEILLMTIIPRRKATREYLGGKRHE
jgi:uncharacterized DUF497 family protein